MSVTTGQSVKIRILPKDNELMNLGASFGKIGESTNQLDTQRVYPRIQARSKYNEYYWCTVNTVAPRDEFLYTSKNFKLEVTNNFFGHEYVPTFSSTTNNNDDVYVLFKSHDDFDESLFGNKKYILLELRAISSKILDECSEIKVQIVDGKPSIVIHCYLDKIEFYKNIEDVYSVNPLVNFS